MILSRTTRRRATASKLNPLSFSCKCQDVFSALTYTNRSMSLGEGVNRRVKMRLPSKDLLNPLSNQLTPNDFQGYVCCVDCTPLLQDSCCTGLLTLKFVSLRKLLTCWFKSVQIWSEVDYRAVTSQKLFFSNVIKERLLVPNNAMYLTFGPFFDSRYLSVMNYKLN